MWYGQYIMRSRHLDVDYNWLNVSIRNPIMYSSSHLLACTNKCWLNVDSLTGDVFQKQLLYLFTDERFCLQKYNTLGLLQSTENSQIFLSQNEIKQPDILVFPFVSNNKPNK